MAEQRRDQSRAPDEVPGRGPDRSPERDARTGRAAAAERIAHQQQYVDQQIRLAMQRGDFDNLPGAGKPIDLGTPHDRDWWLRKLIERERITGVLPPALQLRKDDAELEGQLDALREERAARELLEDFNRRVVEARRQLTGGPPVVTPTRDVETEVAAWRERRLERRRAAAAVLAREEQADSRAAGRRRRRPRWWRRRG
ncbi:MAG TPA: DUF1992 domain-containing protein [Marmoricola sp.]|nr:DUF1992 domain-containing protein [Marmoricola sp.]